MIVSVFHDLLGDLDVFGKGFAGHIDHDGGEAAVDAALAELKAVAVVQMEADGQVGLDDGGLHQLHQIGMVGIGPGALGHLEDQGSFQLLGGLGDALDDFHVVDVEGADGVPSVVGFFEHFGGGNQCHNDHLLTNFICPASGQGRKKAPCLLSLPLRRRKRFSFMIISQKK